MNGFKFKIIIKIIFFRFEAEIAKFKRVLNAAMNWKLQKNIYHTKAGCTCTMYPGMNELQNDKHVLIWKQLMF